jgi:hypothetical protein
MYLIVLRLHAVWQDLAYRAMKRQMNAGGCKLSVCVAAVEREHRTRVEREQCLRKISPLSVKRKDNTYRLEHAQFNVHLCEFLPGNELTRGGINCLPRKLQSPVCAALVSQEVALCM